jgi:ABC-2 type transport system permease protein
MTTTDLSPAAPPMPSVGRFAAIADAITMLHRSLLHIVRYPALTIFVIGAPVIFLIMFVVVLGGTLGAGLPGVDPEGGRAAYLDYVIPGILAITIAGTAGGLATTVSMDMTTGFTARLRTMAVSRGSVLAGHVIGNTIQAFVAVAAVLVTGIIVGFRPTAGALEWLALAGLVTAIAFAVSWVGVAMGIQSKSVETASNMPLLLLMLPFLSSGFVPTDSLPGWMQGFAEFQPFTPFIETIRGLLLGTEIGSNAMISLAWCAAITVAGYVWSVRIYERKSVR